MAATIDTSTEAATTGPVPYIDGIYVVLIGLGVLKCHRTTFDVGSNWALPLGDYSRGEIEGASGDFEVFVSGDDNTEQLSGSGNRSIICEFVPEGGFTSDMVLEVKVTSRMSAESTAIIAGDREEDSLSVGSSSSATLTAVDGIAKRISSQVSYTGGKLTRKTTTLSNLNASASGTASTSGGASGSASAGASTTAVEQSETIRPAPFPIQDPRSLNHSGTATDTLSRRRLISKPFTASVHGNVSASVGSGEGVASVNLDVETVWTIEAKIIAPSTSSSSTGVEETKKESEAEKNRDKELKNRVEGQ